jgi:hypothetical protein
MLRCSVPNVAEVERAAAREQIGVPGGEVQMSVVLRAERVGMCAWYWKLESIVTDLCNVFRLGISRYAIISSPLCLDHLVSMLKQT